jgi:hypothetical protein
METKSYLTILGCIPSHILFLNMILVMLLTHTNDESRLWHERFGHLNFRYLQQLSKVRNGKWSTQHKIHRWSLSRLHTW